MQKSNEGRLADIESSVTKLAKTQDCVFRALLILHKRLSTVSMKHADQDSFSVMLPLMFGIVALVSLVCSLFALYGVTHDIGFKVFAILIAVLDIVFACIYFPTLRSVNRQLRETKKVMSGLEEDLTQVEAEWNDLVHDYSASQPKSDD